MASYKSHTKNDITSYIDFIDKKCKADDVLFRGQQVDKPLLPKIARMETKTNILHAERKMLREFKRRVLPLLDVQPESNWDWLAIAQHHGMPTRLLDWTLNPLAALWFAVNRPPVKEGMKLQPGVVWILFPKPTDYAYKPTNPFTTDRTKIFRPRHIADRLVTQAGWFTVHKLKY